MNLFNGPYLYEVVLLILGAILFVALLVILIIFVANNRSLKPLLLFFAVSIVMMGFPAIGKIKFDKDGVEIDKATKELAENPSNEALKAHLENLIQETKPRLNESKDAPVKIARAEAVLGDSGKGLANAKSGFENRP